MEIFLVEDSAMVRKRISDMLAAVPGTHVAGHASSADTAIREILAVKPDLVVLDLKLAEGNKIDQLRSFLFRTARNILYDMTRQHTTRNTGSLDAFLEEGGDIPAPDDGPGYDPLDIERAMKLLNNLEPPEYKEVIHLRFIEELGVGEIAEILGVSENVVSVRVSRGVAKLRKLLPL